MPLIPNCQYSEPWLTKSRVLSGSHPKNKYATNHPIPVIRVGITLTGGEQGNLDRPLSVVT